MVPDGAEKIHGVWKASVSWMSKRCDLFSSLFRILHWESLLSAESMRDSLEKAPLRSLQRWLKIRSHSPTNCTLCFLPLERVFLFGRQVSIKKCEKTIWSNFWKLLWGFETRRNQISLGACWISDRKCCYLMTSQTYEFRWFSFHVSKFI